MTSHPTPDPREPGTEAGRHWWRSLGGLDEDAAHILAIEAEARQQAQPKPLTRGQIRAAFRHHVLGPSRSEARQQGGIDVERLREALRVSIGDRYVPFGPLVHEDARKIAAAYRAALASEPQEKPDA